MRFRYDGQESAAVVILPQQLELRMEEPESGQLDLSVELLSSPGAEGTVIERTAARVSNGVPLKPNYRLVTYRSGDGRELAKGVIKTKLRKKERAPATKDPRLSQLESLHSDHRWQRIVHACEDGGQIERMTFRRRAVA